MFVYKAYMLSNNKKEDIAIVKCEEDRKFFNNSANCLSTSDN